MKEKLVVKTIGVLIILLVCSLSSAQIPQLINYQGYLTDGDGNPITGSRSIEFRIYDSATGNVLLWNETQSVTVLDGVFSVLLGSVNSIPYTLFDGSERYLALKVGSDSEMSPRKRLVSVGYAFRANTADSLNGKAAGDFVETGDLPDIVSSIDGVTNDGGDVDLIEGSNITITPDDAANTITIAASGGGGGDITAVTAGDGLTGGAATGDATLDVNVGSGLEIVSDAVQVDQATLDTWYVNEGQSNSVNASMISPTVVSSIDGVSNDGGNVDLVAGSNVTITPDDGANTITIAASGGGGGDITAVTAGTGLTGGGTTGGVTLNVAVPLSLSGTVSYPNGIIKGSHTNGNYGYLGGESFAIYGRYQSNGNLGCIGSILYGVHGYSSAGKGVDGSSATGYAVHGNSSSGYGVYGKNNSTGNYGYIGSSYYGVFGRFDSGVNYGYLGSSNYGVRGYNYDGLAGYFTGNVNITGNLTKGSGSFRIDHPLDPANKYLQHSFVESPDMMNIYNGNVMLNGNGEAVVKLPDWFEALNKDFRYQLTAIGAPGPNLYIGEEIVNGQFVIAGGKPGMKVSWQVTGIRKDNYANTHRIQVEVDKTEEERGRYIHPVENGMSKTMSVDYPELQKIMQAPKPPLQENDE